MFTRCIFCRSPLGANETLEHFPHGRRLAFDPARGRLWAVCGACRRWNLAPFEERWEALDELERLTTGGAKLLAQTDNVALLRAGGLELVRVGRAPLAEEAWWRYGRELLRRRGRAWLLFTLDLLVLPVFYSSARAGRFGSVAWRGASACARCGDPLTALGFRRAGEAVLVPGPGGEVSLHLPCPVCGPVREPAGHLLAGADARLLLRRVLAYNHFSGASSELVRAAAGAIEEAGSAEGFTRALAGRRTALDRLEAAAPAQAVALEIALNDETERRLLQVEAAEVERQWREEEEVAAIADRELVFLPGPEPPPAH
ncbi:MAG TPA: hypothetical protein VF746_03675 [Longimicrobium sp.]|jgi:hypothetical protein